MLRESEQLRTQMGKKPVNLLLFENEALRRSDERKRVVRFGQLVVRREGVLKEDTFQALLMLERRRAERSRKPFVLMVLDGQLLDRSGDARESFAQVISVLSRSTRETDLIGWYKEDEVLAVLFTEVSCEGKRPVTETLHSKVMSSLRADLDNEIVSAIRTTIHLFPEDNEGENAGPVADIRLYPDLSDKEPGRRLSRLLKRAIDVLGSSSLLLLLSPLYGLIALAIRLTSQGPIIFKQNRLGQFGSRFQCLKFRTMYVNNSSKVHQDYIAKFIAGQTESTVVTEGKTGVYKITNDPRITSIGRLLRKTSLDELPQFWNVLRGEMSLVGPRPPVPYEYKIYDIWHRRRVLEAKPGVTGLWQVSGRSRMSFDEMVRLDLRYCQSWSLWLDLKILVATPKAVLTGDGAY